MQKAEETYESLREEASHREQEENNKLKQLDHENEEKPEDYPEEIVKSGEAQGVVNTVEQLAEKGKTEEEIIEELEFPKEEELESEDQYDEEEAKDYKEEIGNPAQIQDYIDTIEKMDKEGKTKEEIVKELEDEEISDKFKEKLDILHEKEVQETLKQVNHLNEEEEEDYKEEIDNPAAMQDIVDIVEKLDKEGNSDEKINEILTEKKELEGLAEDIEKLLEKEVQENLKRVNHLNEEEEQDYKELIDNQTAMQEIVDDVENLVDREEEGETTEKSTEKEVLDGFKEQVKNLHEQEVQEKLKPSDHLDGEEQDNFPKEIKSQQEIEQFIAKLDEEGEVKEEKKSYEKQQVIEELQDGTEMTSIEKGDDKEFNENEEEIEIIENNELGLVQIIKDESAVNETESEVEEIEDKEFEKLKNLYRKTTGKRPMYAGKETKEFSKWLEKLVEESQELVEQFKEQEEKEERWQETLRNWINEVPEEISSELKKILMEIIHDPDFYERLRDFLIDFSKLVGKFEKGRLSEKESEKFVANLNDLMKTSQIHLNLYENLRAFKDFFYEHSVWNPDRISHIRKAFLSRLSEKFKVITKSLTLNTVKLATLKISSQKVVQSENQEAANYFSDQIDVGSKTIDEDTKKLAIEDRKIQLIFKKYLKETGHYPNYGEKFRKKFIEWVTDYETKNQDYKILPRLERIQDNKEIYSYIINKIQNTKYSLIAISNLLKKLGLSVHSKTIGKISREFVFDNNLEAYKDRMTHIYAYHPKIKLNYFKEINTKEKAYWLGFIFADGGLSFQTSRNNIIRFNFGLNIKDKDSKEMVYRLAKTLGIEEKNVGPCSRGNMLKFSITNNTLALHLNRHGVIIGKNKSKNIELPEFGRRELDLAFLLGYYDGDGTEGSTVITSGSKKFLDQIKEKYKIEYDLRYKYNCSQINGKEVKGEAWDLALGARLFNELMKNYSFSMQRKRKIFETPEEKSERMRKFCISRAKLDINEFFLEDLKKLVWKMPLYKIADKYNISNSRISDICKQYGIMKPPIGYWKKMN